LPALESMGEARGVPADEVYEWLRSKGTDNELPRPKSK
jgi:predicted transcriptional regulator